MGPRRRGRPWAVAWVLLPALAWTAPVLGDWLQYRGDGRGHSLETRLPLAWGEDHNVAWKTPLPGRGFSSPVVVDGKVWLTTALEEEKSLRLLGIDASDGRVVHDLEVFRPEAWQAGHPENSYASPTPVAEPGRVCVHFGTYGTACFDTGGKLLWQGRPFVQEHEVGPGSSPILWNNLLIVNCDGTDSQFVAALDKRTGELAWKTLRRYTADRKPPHRKAFSTPFVYRHGGRTLLLSTGAAHTSAYDPATGEERWWLPHDGYSNVPMPAVGLGKAFVNTGYIRPHLLAVPLGGEGELAPESVLWTYHWQVPANPSPLLIGARLFMVNDQGNATWLDARNGKDLWRKRLQGRHYASPLTAHGKIFAWGVDGKTTVIRADDRFEILAENRLDGEIRATPAISDHAFFIRTDSALYRIQDLGESAKPAPEGSP